jgi:coenzyme F420-reducing hydrogenase beta subunit
MQEDSEGFAYPEVNLSTCIDCGQCETVCPYLRTVHEDETMACYASRSSEHIGVSSSGGIFPLLASSFIKSGGMVVGAAFGDVRNVRHKCVDSMDELPELYGSKYVQSDTGDTFCEVERCLKAGRPVLYSGTPCQIAGLKGYLSEDYPQLLTIDVACHGVPSPGLWRRYVSAMEDKYKTGIDAANFRDKSGSWKRYAVRYSAGQKSIRVNHSDDPYMLLFLQNVSLRPSCYDCSFRSSGSGSDITLGDLWNVASVAPELHDDKGASVIVVKTLKGLRMLEQVFPDAMREIDRNEAVAGNSGFAAALAVPELRGRFFDGLSEASSLPDYIEGFIDRKSWALVIYGKLHSLAARIKRKMFR